VISSSSACRSAYGSRSVGSPSSARTSNAIYVTGSTRSRGASAGRDGENPVAHPGSAR
jgi:hypothetical protein